MSQLSLRLKGLSQLPEPCIGSPYEVRTFRPGDEQGMTEIFRADFGEDWCPEKVFKDMVNWDGIGPDRIFNAVAGSQVVGTATAWFRPDRYPDAGYLHMVGSHREHRHLGIGRAVSLAALECFRRARLDAAVLHTDDHRKPALSLYFELGFRPELTEADHLDRWRALCRELRRPDILEMVEWMDLP